jgi:ABC-type branched-subunit amino acid transport system substrate-binding protein
VVEGKTLYIYPEQYEGEESDPLIFCTGPVPAQQVEPLTGSLQQDAVVRALDHARIAEGPGGAAAMVPGQHHVRMNMFIAQARSGRFQVVKDLG